jgi:hypothetical protein
MGTGTATSKLIESSKMKDMTPVWIPKSEFRFGKILCWLGHHPPVTHEEAYDYLNIRASVVCRRCKKVLFRLR